MTTPGLDDGQHRHNPVAPFESCIACFKGDTTTGVALKGEAEFLAAAMTLMGVPTEQAMTTISYITGCDPGYVPPGDITIPLRVCEDCGKKAKLTVADVSNGEFPLYVQPEETRMM